MAELVSELSSYYDTRFSSIWRMKELVSDYAPEREEVLLEVKRESLEIQRQLANCREAVSLWRTQMEEAARCLSVIQAWTARHNNQPQIPAQALRRTQQASVVAAPNAAPPTSKAPTTVAQKGGASKAPTCVSRPQTKVQQLAYITLTQFEKVPKYMKGRATYECVNTAVDDLNAALREKYTFLARKMTELGNPAAKKRHQALKAQETKDTRGVHFVTSEDLKASTCLRTETNRRCLLPVLRHFGLLREIRGPGNIVRFAVVNCAANNVL